MPEHHDPQRQVLRVIDNATPGLIDSSTLRAPLPGDGRGRTVDGGGRGLRFRAGHGLTPSERAALGARRDALAELLEPASAAERAAQIHRLLKGMMTGESGADDLVQDAYHEALLDAPLFALAEARATFFAGRAVVAGRALDPHWPPKPPELALLVRQCAEPYRLQLARAAALLAAPEEPPAPVVTPEEIARRQRLADERLSSVGFLIDDAVSVRRMPPAPPQDIEADRRRALDGLAADLAALDAGGGA